MSQSVYKDKAAPVPPPSAMNMLVPLVRDFEEGMEDKTKWRTFMAGPSQKLEALFRSNAFYEVSCTVCSSQINGVQDHLQSQNHWKRLWSRFTNNQLPPSEVASAMDKPWVQTFDLRTGRYFFNHLTGDQGFLDGCPVSPSTPVSSVYSQGEASVVASTPLPPCAFPPDLPDPWQEGRANMVRAGLAPPPLQPKARPPPQQRLDDFQEALNSKAGWRTFMDGPAKILEQTIFRLTNSYDVTSGTCPVCMSEMSRGAGEHLPSCNHWKQLWRKLECRTPDVQTAHDWVRPWVQRFPTPKGDYVFNHVTGRQGFASELGISLVAPAPQEPLRALPGIPQPTPCISDSAPSAIVPLAVRRPEEFNLGLWTWRLHIKDGANQLNSLLQGTGQFLQCTACSQVMGPDVAAHLASNGHYTILQEKARPSVNEAVVAMMTADPEAAKRELASGPWVQAFNQVPASPTGMLKFNHLTGELKYE